jgi:hypothetical protein
VLKKTLCATALFLLLAPAAQAQLRGRTPRTVPPPPPPLATRPGRIQGPSSRPGPIGSPEAEILKRAEIRSEEENYKEMVERAGETAQIGRELRSTFDKYKALSREDLKRLERMEKLARKIRGGAGGDDDDEELKDPPAQLDQTVARLAEVSEKLDESVRKGSRLVISGAVIERSNELIELVRHIKTFVKP